MPWAERQGGGDTRGNLLREFRVPMGPSDIAEALGDPKGDHWAPEHESGAPQKVRGVYRTMSCVEALSKRANRVILMADTDPWAPRHLEVSRKIQPEL